jgi:hypothetical protein
MSAKEDFVFISYKNPNPKLTELKQELTRLNIKWLDDPDPSQPLLERLHIQHIQREKALSMGPIYGCDVWTI